MPTQRAGRKEMFRQTLVARARQMRKELTPAELKLWSASRGDQLMGFRFRRQHRIGSYIADFFCHAARIVVEVDGDSHEERVEYDAKRTYWMSQEGLSVIRFTNDEVLKNLDGVLAMIGSWCTNAIGPSPQPSPPSTGKREKEGA
jgi:very-short-patch-repair endonuclease